MKNWPPEGSISVPYVQTDWTQEVKQPVQQSHSEISPPFLNVPEFPVVIS